VVRTAVSAASQTTFTVQCNAGERAFGGGGSANVAANNQTITGSVPVTSAGALPTGGQVAGGWRVTTNFAATITVYAICGF
jgi:hypothetical protein